MKREGRRSLLFAFGTAVAGLAMAGTAFGCVTFKGKMTVDGHDGDTTVVGTGNQHAYCGNGAPATAAAGHIADSIKITVAPGTCADSGSLSSHQLPDGTYEVRFNNRTSYVGLDGTGLTMAPNAGCFFAANAPTTTTLGSFTVTGGNGTWTGSLGSLPPGVAVYSTPGTASNLCVGAPGIAPAAGDSGGAPGMLAPYRLLLI